MKMQSGPPGLSRTPPIDPVLEMTAHRPYPLPAGMWRLRQRWNDLLFAHWPIAPDRMAALLPAGLELDIFDGWAWIGVVPFWMDHVQTRAMGQAAFAVPTVSSFMELNLRTYVRSPRTGKHGVYFFALDCASLLAVLGARVLFHLPYFPARMTMGERAGGIRYQSRRMLTRRTVGFDASYRPLAAVPEQQPDELARFLTERYCLFTPHRGRILCGDIHHRIWPLEPAEAELRRNDLPAAHGISLPNRPPVLHFSRSLEVYLWPLRPDVPLGAGSAEPDPLEPEREQEQLV